MGAPLDTGALIAPQQASEKQHSQPKKTTTNYHRIFPAVAVVALFLLTIKNLCWDVAAGSAIIQQHLQQAEEAVIVSNEVVDAPMDLKLLADKWTSDGKFPLLSPPSIEDVEVTKKSHLDRLARMRGNFRIGLHWKSNEEQLKKLVEILQDPATTEIPNVVMSGYKYFTCALIDDLPECSTSGETIWMRSVIAALKTTNTLFLSTAPDSLMDMHAALGDIITHVFAEDGFSVACWNDRNCIQSYHNPGGIPPHKLFVTSFWGHPTMYGRVHTDFGDWEVPDSSWSWSPLGSEWTLSPYSYPDSDYYLGYSVEGDCDADAVVPHAERNDEIIVLGKRLEYFGMDRSWPEEFYQTVSDATNMTLISTAKTHDERNFPGLTLPAGLEARDVSITGRKEYEKLVGNTKAMLGMFYPPISPSPYNSLCQGVPVVMPYSGTNPVELGSEKWSAFDVTKVQHGPAALLGEPYVYSVDVNAPIEETIETIKRAINTPIEPYIPEEMTQKAVRERVETFLSIDWELFAGMRMYELELSEREMQQPQWMIDECEKDGSFCQRVRGYRPNYLRRRSTPPVGGRIGASNFRARMASSLTSNNKLVCWDCE